MSDLALQERPEFLTAGIQPPGKSIDDCASMVKRYKQVRQLGTTQAGLVAKLLDKPAIHEGAAKLNLLQGDILFFDGEEDTAVLFDYCTHDVWRNGRNVILQYLADSPPPDDSIEMRILQGSLSAVFSVFGVEKARPGVGVEVLDLFRGGRRALIDVSLGNCARPGVVMCGRLMEVDGITMTTGAMIGGDFATFERVMAALQRKNETSALLHPVPERRSAATALVIRHFLAYRNGLQRSLAAEPEPQRTAPVKSTPRVGRNDPCPCGSGIKYKKCCG